jgi:hypothetical protein
MRRIAKFISDGVGEESFRPNFLLDTGLARAAAREDRATSRWRISPVVTAATLAAVAWGLVIGAIWLVWHLVV